MKRYDLIVVGGGPGGSVAAKTAAESGLKTIVLERGIKPGDKNVSGTGLSPKCFRDFDFMKQMDFPRTRVATMATLHYSDAENVEKLNFSFSPSARGPYPEAREFLTKNVYRSDLDPWLAGLANEAGAEFRTATRVSSVNRGVDGKITGVVTDSGEKIHGDIIIGADGVISTVARTAGIREKWDPGEVAMILNVDYGAAREDINRVIGGNALHYWYSGIFPVGYTFFSAEGFHAGLGCYVNWWKKSPHYYLKKMFELEGVQRQIELCGGEPREFQNHMVTFLLDPKSTYADSVMLVGDAAGFACPFEAEGVYYAMYSGMLAAKVALEAHGSGDTRASFLKRYEKAWRASPVGEEFIAGETIDGFVRGIGFNPDAGRWIVPMLNDAAYGLLNVAESHTASARNLPAVLAPYLPILVETLGRDLLPLSNRMAEPPAKRPSPTVERLLRKVLPPVLPFFARRSARAHKSRYSEVMSEIMVDGFMKPYAEEKARMSGGAIR
ncbi:MAG: NAD(P)/FAD-dependent oxidoreductase [Actinobacteria bacterium]|nr:NAD(P)/FAD-dependent oxidoreductase [Actinomycetota bacterium]MCG2819599.1 NAD(P)/FAD-dependent oxidoreductase [Actinomycetes bacterium]MBU4217803.1 NAD(P)/FAD-dependent oxidoreductase [Actinomycetota bacterium]MBU4391472.1 NAD(P)/FAD-dependent oxidoreductase [Actinomycetota bacterium]MBU4403820.1 NAD(P)/FAD-dependent oxidoreductase [Actinomycetota bacterium]